MPMHWAGSLWTSHWSRNRRRCCSAFARCSCPGSGGPASPDSFPTAGAHPPAKKPVPQPPHRCCQWRQADFPQVLVQMKPLLRVSLEICSGFSWTCCGPPHFQRADLSPEQREGCSFENCSQVSAHECLLGGWLSAAPGEGCCCWCHYS